MSDRYAMTSALADLVGRKLRYLLKETKVTQVSLARFLGVDPSAMNRYVKGLRMIDFQSLFMISDLYLIPLEALLRYSYDKFVRYVTREISEKQFENVRWFLGDN